MNNDTINEQNIEQSFQENSNDFGVEQMLDEFNDKSNTFINSYQEKPKDVDFDSYSCNLTNKSFYTSFSDCFFVWTYLHIMLKLQRIF